MTILSRRVVLPPPIKPISFNQAQHPMQSLNQLYSLPLSQIPIVVIDLETSGLHSHLDAICEIGAVRLENSVITDEYETLVNPRRMLRPEVIAIHQLTNEMLLQAPALADVLPSFLQFVGSAVIAGHNVGFDLGFLRPALHGLGVDLTQRPILDTAQLARKLLPSPRGYSLVRLAEQFQLPATQFHRALGDARTTAHLLCLLLDILRKQGISTLAQVMNTYPFEGVSSSHKKLSPLEQTLLQAVEHALPVEIRYRNRDDQVGERRITPERLASPYVYAFCHLRQEQRCFRVDRIEHYRILTDPLDVVPDPDSSKTELS